ncbi:unnamed protein product [Amoebophrya sp. A120]|nr:unnamed protein product [Amoebophrya sp. A120]|eukprot:GSA120T00001251001.1
MPPVKECITVHLGQAGCQVGLQVWELMCEEHGILPDGTRDEIHGESLPDDPLNSFFAETAAGQHVPRAVFMDTDPATRIDLLNASHGKTFHPDSLLAYKQDCRSNFFEGRSASNQYKIKESVMDAVRKEVDKCQSLQGFFVFHSFGGGTGTGVGVEVLDTLRAQFAKKVIMQPLVYPSQDYVSSVVEPYNCMFATAYTRENVDLAMVLDNQAAYRMCRENLKVKHPTFLHLNRIIAQMVSAATTSLRFATQLNASLDEVVTNMVPEVKFRYPILSLSPVRHPSRAKHENFTTRELITDLFEEKNFLADIGPGKLKQNRYLACSILMRGFDRLKKEDLQDHLTEVIGDGSEDAEGYIHLAIQPLECTAAIQELMNPSGGHREGLKFLPWLGHGGFKIGAVAEPPHVPEGFMAKSDRQGALLANTTAVRTLFMRTYQKFLKLFYHKAYVWQFLEANGELEMFFEAKERMHDMIAEYEDILYRTCEQERVTDNNLTLVGARPGGPGAGPAGEAAAGA